MVLATLAMVGITHNAATNTLELCRAACGVFMIPFDSTELVVDPDYIACVLLRLICFGMVLVNDAASCWARHVTVLQSSLPIIGCLLRQVCFGMVLVNHDA